MPNEEGDLNYLHKDGKLHVIGKGPLDHDHYCIENIQKKSGAFDVSYLQINIFSCFFFLYINFSFFADIRFSLFRRRQLL